MTMHCLLRKKLVALVLTIGLQLGQAATAQPAEEALKPTPPPPAREKAKPERKDVKPKKKKVPFMGVGAMLDFLFTTGGPSSTSAGEATESGGGFVVTALVSFRGYIPVSEILSIWPAVDVGWFRIAGGGMSNLPNDPDFSDFKYTLAIDNLLLFAGASVALKLIKDVPLYLSIGGGFASTYSWAESAYEKGEEEPVTNAIQSAWGTGYYLGLEAAYQIGPGRITLEYRYSSVRTDLRFKDVYDDTYSRELGDLGGSNILLGYRLNIPW